MSEMSCEGSDGRAGELSCPAVIRAAQALPCREEQIDFLAVSGEYFLSQRRFSEAERIAQHVLRNLDENSPKARRILIRTLLESGT